MLKRVDELTRNRLVERVIEKMAAIQQKAEPLVPPKTNRNPAQIRPSVEMQAPRLERPSSPEFASNQEYQSTINRLLSVIENKFLDIVILIDGSDSFNQINEGR